MSNSEVAAKFSSARQNPNLVVLDGFHAFKHAVRFHANIEQIVTADAARLLKMADNLAPDIIAELKKSTELSPNEFALISDHPTGVAALAQRPSYDLNILKHKRTSPLVLLEKPQRLNNVGASIRVAAAAGASGLMVLGDKDPWHAEAIRGAAGLQFALPVGNIDAFPNDVEGPVVALDAEGDPIDPNSIPDNAILIFGTEREGISPELLARADARVALPMRPGVSSLNLATSVAAALYAWRLLQ